MTPQERYTQAVTLLQAGAWGEAAQLLQALASEQPDHGCIHHLLGKAEAQLGHHHRAESLQLQSCLLDPGLGWNWFALGELQERRGALEEAVAAFAQAAEALPQQPWLREHTMQRRRRLRWQELRGLGATARIGLEELEQLVWLLRPELREHLGGEREQLRLWLLLEGPREYLAAVVLRDALLAWFRPLAQQVADLPPLAEAWLEQQAPPISAFLLAIWEQQPHLQRRFDLNSLAGRVGLVQWFALEGSAHHQLQELVTEQKQTEVPSSKQAATPLAPARPFGVNLIGYARGQLGIGEDVRMAVQALDAVGVPCSVFNVDPDAAIDCNETSLDGRINDELPYRFNLFCLTGIETARVGLRDYAPLMLREYINIGYWPWEFARWPAQWRVASQLVDELWASSRFTAEAYSAMNTVPVQWMPMLVDVKATAGLTQQDFGLEAKRYWFVFSFDGSSSLRRKNPLAVLEAFESAFPTAQQAEVGLVVKVMRRQRGQRADRDLQRRVEADPRIRLIEETLPRAAVLDLYRCCHAYVSLHRCEGFGRGMAEAMLLDKAVIATNYSGNVDFCTAQTSQLIPARLVPVLPGDYPEATGLEWAEPDVDAAAEAMARCASGAWRPDHNAVQEVRSAHSATVVGERYKQRLLELEAAAHAVGWRNTNTRLERASVGI